MDLLDEIENENLYQVLVAIDGRTLKIVLLKMQGYSTKEIAPLVYLTTGAGLRKIRPSSEETAEGFVISALDCRELSALHTSVF